MKKVLVLPLLFIFMTPFAFTQTKEEIKEEIKIETEQLKKEMEELSKELKEAFKDFKVDLEGLEIDLSGLDQLKDFDWKDDSG